MQASKYVVLATPSCLISRRVAGGSLPDDVMSAVVLWHEPMVDLVVRDHAVNDSALPQLETMQMKYRVTRCVEVSTDGL